LLSGSAVLLIHDRRLLGLVDDWVSAVHDEVFEDVLPLLRRTFSAFSRPERREIGEQLSHGVDSSAEQRESAELDLTRAEPAIRTMARYLGWEAKA
jgi:hypothetical protein